MENKFKGDLYDFKSMAIGQVSVKISELTHIGQVFPCRTEVSQSVSLMARCGGI